jgi:hypothetical protein
MNLYAYVGNDPLNLTDPAGLLGIIVSYGVQADIGLPPFAQAGGQVSQNLAFLINTSQWSLSNPFALNFSIVSYQSYGGTAALGLPTPPPGLTQETTNPLGIVADQGQYGIIAGAYAGQGFSVGFTNANTAADFAPNSATISANVGLLGFNFGGQYSTTSSGVWTTTVALPGLSYGQGVEASLYQTQTSVQTIATTEPVNNAVTGGGK